MHETVPDRRAGCKRARAGAGAITMRALLLALLAAGPHVPSSDALKLASISEDRGHLGVGLLRAVEVVRGRYERAWALISAAEPTAEELETALELLQVRDRLRFAFLAVLLRLFFCTVFCIGFCWPCGPHRQTHDTCSHARWSVRFDGSVAETNGWQRLLDAAGQIWRCVFATLNRKLPCAHEGFMRVCVCSNRKHIMS